jgi:MFS transporter, ACS family, D-galactonate transporter
MSSVSRAIVPHRWRIPPILALTILVSYLNRNNLSLALPRLADDFGWSDREVGANGELLLGVFFVSYGLANMLLSPIAERIGAKRSLMLTIGAFSLITILCAIFGNSLELLIGLRLLLGLAQGVHVPMLSSLIGRWFPEDERSRANAIWIGGIFLATAIAPLLLVPAIHAWGWRLAFAVLGAVGCVVTLPLVYFGFSDQPPQWLDETSERGDRSTAATMIPSSGSFDYLRTLPFWIATIASCLNGFCAFGFLNWLPTYFNRAKGIDFEQLGWPLALVFLSGIIGIFSMAFVGDRLRHRTQLAGVGFVLAGWMVFLAAQSTEVTPLVTFFSLAVFFQGAYNAQEYAIVQRILPADRLGAGTGIYNGISVLLGGIGGSFIPGSIVAATGSFDAGMFSLIVGAGLAALTMFGLSRLVRY